jgi:hypothetical protein
LTVQLAEEACELAVNSLLLVAHSLNPQSLQLMASSMKLSVASFEDFSCEPQAVGSLP